jgi:hypothetical protein
MVINALKAFWAMGIPAAIIPAGVLTITYPLMSLLQV